MDTITLFLKKFSIITLALAFASALLLTSCGGGDDSSDLGISTGVTATEAGNQLATAFNALNGTELSVPTTTGTNSGIDYSYTVKGFSFCLPSNLYADPAVSAPANQTVYGCANAVTASAVLDTTAMTLTVSLSSPNLYIDIDGSFTILSTPYSYHGALTGTNLTVDFVFNVIQQVDGNYKVDSLKNVTNMSGTWTLQTDNISLNAYLGSISGFIEGAMTTQLSNFLSSDPTSFVTNAPKIKP